MLTAFQAEPIAYWADTVQGVEQGEGPFCSDCAEELAGGAVESGGHDEMFIHYYNTPLGFQPASRYDVEEAYYPDGIDCVRCRDVIVEEEDEEEDDEEYGREIDEDEEDEDE